MICKNKNKRRQEFNSWQKTKSKEKTLQGPNGPWQKLRVFTLIKFSLLQENKSVGTMIKDKVLCYYRKSSTISKSKNNGIHFRLLSAKADSHYPLLLTNDNRAISDSTPI